MPASVYVCVAARPQGDEESDRDAIVDVDVDVAGAAPISAPDAATFSRHLCYVLHNATNNATYNGYTVDFAKRLRQHNCDIQGGARYTSRMVNRKGVKWLPLAIVRFPDGTVDHRRALSCEWSLRYPDNRRPRPAKYNGARGRIAGLADVVANPKFADLSMSVQVFSRWALDLLNVLTQPQHAHRVTVELVTSTHNWGPRGASVDVRPGWDWDQ
jgi:predicted GIY-YIG superfamily endonuclease